MYVTSTVNTDVPPRPTSPYPLRVTSSAVTIAWDESACDGGHRISGYTIRYRKTFQEYLTTTNMYVHSGNPLVKNYTIIGLETYTAYNFSVQAISAEFLPSEFSLEYIITTTAEGRKIFVHILSYIREALLKLMSLTAMFLTLYRHAKMLCINLTLFCPV